MKTIDSSALFREPIVFPFVYNKINNVKHIICLIMHLNV